MKGSSGHSQISGVCGDEPNMSISDKEINVRKRGLSTGRSDVLSAVSVVNTIIQPGQLT